MHNFFHYQNPYGALGSVAQWKAPWGPIRPPHHIPVGGDPYAYGTWWRPHGKGTSDFNRVAVPKSQLLPARHIPLVPRVPKVRPKVQIVFPPSSQQEVDVLVVVTEGTSDDSHLASDSKQIQNKHPAGMTAEVTEGISDDTHLADDSKRRENAAGSSSYAQLVESNT